MDKIRRVKESPSFTAIVSGKYELSLISSEGTAYVLSKVGDALKEALIEHTEGEYSYEELARRLSSGEAQLWIAAEKSGKVVLVGVTRVLRYPAKMRLSVDLIVGEDLNGCASLLDVVASWAKQFDCTEIEATCRPGVRKVMEKHGFRKAYDVIVKPIYGSTH